MNYIKTSLPSRGPPIIVKYLIWKLTCFPGFPDHSASHIFQLFKKYIQS